MDFSSCPGIFKKIPTEHRDIHPGQGRRKEVCHGTAYASSSLGWLVSKKGGARLCPATLSVLIHAGFPKVQRIKNTHKHGSQKGRA